MKKISILLIALSVLTSCGGESQKSVESLVSEGNLEAIRAKKAEISEQQKTLSSQMEKLDSAIATFTGNERLDLVTTITANTREFNHYLELQGNVSTKQNVLIYPEMQGALQRVYVREGQSVSKGQLLASIDDGGMGSQLAQLKTQEALAKTTFERQKRLWDQKIGSEIQFLEAKATFEAAVNAVRQAQSQLAKSNIRAPFSGIIDDVIKEQGTVVSPGPGSEIFRIVNLSDMYIEVDVPESYIGNLSEGSAAKVFFPVLGDTVNTSIRQTGNHINPNNRAFKVEIPVPNTSKRIKPNLTAKVSLNDYTNAEAILIPQGIISENAEGQQYVYVAKKTEEDKAAVSRRIINTGRTQGSMVEVLSGIKIGDLLIKEGARNVKDGQKVQILNNSTDE